MKLPSECVECIIKHIDESDIKTLYSTTLVNHNWCKFSIIRLWRTPLSFSKFISNSKNLNSNSKINSATSFKFKNFFKIIPILLSFLDSQTKKDLKILSKQFYIPKDTLNFYPKLQSDLKICIDDLKVSPIHDLLFDYPKFIKHVNFIDLIILVNKWLNNLLNEILSTPSIFLNFNLYKSFSKLEYIRYITNSINLHCPFIHFDKNSQNFFNFILESLIKVLINHSKIDSLSIMNDTLVAHHLCNQLNQLDPNSNNDHFLSNLSSFDFCQNINSNMLKKLSELIHNTITTISISIISNESDDVDVIISFINSINSLLSVSILGNNTNVTPIIQSLQNHISTLVTLNLNSCTIDNDSLKSLSNFNHLQELTFHQLYFTFNEDDYNIDDDIISTTTTQMAVATAASTTKKEDNYLIFPQLKKLNYWEYSSTNSLITFIIKNNGHNLSHLDIHTSMERCIKLFDTISKYCPFIISLKTPISEEKDFKALFSILENCKFLKILYIYELNIININDFVILSFVKSIPDSLSYLKINKLEFSQFKLGYKLKDCSIISEVLLGKNSLAVKEFFSSSIANF